MPLNLCGSFNNFIEFKDVSFEFGRNYCVGLKGTSSAPFCLNGLLSEHLFIKETAYQERIVHDHSIS